MRTHSSCVLFYILYQSHQIKRNSFWIKCSLTSRFTSWWATARRSPRVLLRRGTSIRRWTWLSRWGYPTIHYTHLICQSEISYLFPPSLSPRGSLFSSCTEESEERIVIREICFANKQIFCPPLTESDSLLWRGDNRILIDSLSRDQNIHWNSNFNPTLQLNTKSNPLLRKLFPG